MLYAIVAQDIPNSLPLRKEARPEHIKRLENLKQLGRLILAGPNPAIDNEDPGESGFTGSIIIAEFDNLSDAENWANDDPYLAAGVYQSVTVKPFKKVLP
ncbi:YciI family protein [Aliikangiella sp. IMCC44359]|uniref:YciI family protein n=1 Tax=Aliikangiella sp. IMCC44359 TaxID=3459125 RepID=UPI00403AE17C